MRKARSVTIAKADFIEGMAKGMAVLESFDTERQRLNATLAAQRAGITRAAARVMPARCAASVALSRWRSVSKLSSTAMPLAMPSMKSALAIAMLWAFD